MYTIDDIDYIIRDGVRYFIRNRSIESVRSIGIHKLKYLKPIKIFGTINNIDFNVSNIFNGLFLSNISNFKNIDKIFSYNTALKINENNKELIKEQKTMFANLIRFEFQNINQKCCLFESGFFIIEVINTTFEEDKEILNNFLTTINQIDCIKEKRYEDITLNDYKYKTRKELNRKILKIQRFIKNKLKKIRLHYYILYLVKIYLNPESIALKYRIENFDKEKENCMIFINSQNKLIRYKFI